MCQFIFEQDYPGFLEEDPTHPLQTAEIGPMQQLLDEINLAPGGPYATTLEVGIYDLAEIPADQLHNISGILFQIDEYWYKKLEGFELDFDDDRFSIRPVRVPDQ